MIKVQVFYTSDTKNNSLSNPRGGNKREIPSDPAGIEFCNIIMGSTPPCGKRPEGQQEAYGKSQPMHRIRALSNCRCRQPCPDDPEPEVPPRAGGGTPNSKPSTDGCPHHDRIAGPWAKRRIRSARQKPKASIDPLLHPIH